ncbi:MAG TPA: contractile injection system tape measure protein [Saprospiraceae bacterium]|nr:contractile injection system tape measure protein [Saprospiraceae bacterium]
MTIAGHTHIIQKQTLELSGNNIQVVHKLETDAPRLIHEVLNPVIDQCLALAGDEMTKTLISRIEIDLGVFQDTTFEKEVAVRLRERLMEKLHTRSDIYRKEESGSANPVNAHDKDSRIRVISRKNASLIALLHYLRNGNLPWWWDDEKSPLESWKQLHDEESVTAILKGLGESRSAISRAIAALDDQFLGLIIQRAGYSKAILQAWTEIRRTFEAHTAQYRQCRSIYWEYCLARIFNHLTSIEGATASTVGTIRKLAFLSQQELEFFFLTVFATHGEIAEHYFSRHRAPKDLSRDFIAHDGHRSDEKPDTQASSSPKDFASEGPESQDVERHTDSVIRQETTEYQHVTGDKGAERKAERVQEDSFIQNAGVILVHPFLEELFRTRSLTSKNQFISHDARTHAIRLLDYLVSGTDESAEYDLLLPKLLCGMPWEDALVSDVTLSNDDKGACNELLSAIISHWKALRSTGIDGLREGFFARPGILEHQQEDWRLRVEARAQDILLSRLPWGLSTIRLPWMNETLFVTWV